MDYRSDFFSLQTAALKLVKQMQPIRRAASHCVGAAPFVGLTRAGSAGDLEIDALPPGKAGP